MLAFAEDYLGRTRAASSDESIIAILAELAGELGFRSAFLVEYALAPKAAPLVLDSNSARDSWWNYYMATGMMGRNPVVTQVLGKGGVQYAHVDRLTKPDDPLRDYAKQIDMMSTMVVPVTVEQQARGVVVFCGERVLGAEQERAVQFICHTLFAQVRSFHATGVMVAGTHLTPREKEVMELSSEGLTAHEVGERLGMSPRTVNQHMDNVADKLGTRNRVQTVAEAIRRDLL